MYTQSKIFVSNYVVLTVRKEKDKSERGTREGWLFWLLKMRWMGTQRVQMKGVPPWLVRWTCRAGTRDFCSALAALIGPDQNIFLLTVHCFNSFVPIAQQAGKPAVLGRLSLKGAQAWPNRVRIFLHKSNLYGLVTWEQGQKKYLGCFEPCTTL